MQCQLCNQNTATIHLTEISDGQRMETHLCETCAQKEGIAVKNQIPLNELLSTLLSVQGQSQSESSLSSEGIDADTACPLCGITLKQFSKQSLLGCPNDYEFFQSQLNGLIEKAHCGKTTHCGKVPSKLPTEDKSKIELITLRKELDEAVKNEDYETAAKLRDRINKLQ